MTTEGENTGFWTVAIGAPVLLSVLRLWVQAGGDLQTTLVLVENIHPINMLASLTVTGFWLVTAVVVAALALGGVLNASGEAGRRVWVARWASRAPLWVKAGSFGFAAITWQLIFLPMLVVAACAAFQLSPWQPRRAYQRMLILIGALGFYVALVGPTLLAAWRLPRGSAGLIATLLLAAPAVLMLVVAGPVRPRAVRPLAIGAQLIAVALLMWAVVPLVTTPVLPLTVTVVTAAQPGQPDECLRTPDQAQNEYLRGYMVASNNVNTIFLDGGGQIRYVPNCRISAQQLCPSRQQAARYGLALNLPNMKPVPVEHSVLSALGAANRATIPPSPVCLATAR